MGSSNDGREKIQRLNEHKAMPIRLIGGSMKVFTTVSHKPKPTDQEIRQVMILMFDLRMVKSMKK